MRVETDAFEGLAAVLDAFAPLRRAVGAGLGPNGRGTLLGSGLPEVLDTGCALARHIPEPAGPGGAALRILRETLVEAERDLGDGTARLVIGVDAMLREAHRAMLAGMAPQILADELRSAAGTFTQALRRMAVDEPDLRTVARSAGAGEPLAEALAGLARAVGPAGLIRFAPADNGVVEAHCESAFVFERAAAPQGHEPTALHRPHILVANEMIEDFGHLAPLLDGFARHGKTLLVLARGIGGAALQTLALNRDSLRGSVSALSPAAVGREAGETLRDAALACGATLVCSQEGTTLASVSPAMLGRAGSLEVRRDRASLIKPEGDPALVAARVRELRAEAERHRFLDLDRERYLLRAARLAGQQGELCLGGRDREGERLRRAGARASASVLSAMRGGALQGSTALLARALGPQPRTRGEQHAYGCLAAAIGGFHLHLARNAEPGLALPASALARLRVAAASSPVGTVQDPLPLTCSIVERAKATASLLGSPGAYLSRVR